MHVHTEWVLTAVVEALSCVVHLRLTELAWASNSAGGALCQDCQSSGGSRILKGGGSAVQNVFDCARARARGRRCMRAKRQKGVFRDTQGTPLDPPLQRVVGTKGS